MRVIVIVVAIIVLIIVLMWADVGQGLNACLQDCREEHCGGANVSLDQCESDAFEPCRDACYEEFREEE
ncbi:MAG: hypothetical protein ACQEXJ_10115 [Myxococcota bacterium]